MFGVKWNDHKAKEMRQKWHEIEVEGTIQIRTIQRNYSNLKINLINNKQFYWLHQLVIDNRQMNLSHAIEQKKLKPSGNG